MTKKSYTPIHSNSTNTTFLSYIDLLDIPQIDYFAIGIQNTSSKTSMSLMSLQEWQNHFIKNQFAEHDPLRKIALSTNRTLIHFDEIDFVDNFGKEIMRQRSRMGIKNGIILMQRIPGYNYMITLGTGFSKFSAYDFIKRYHDKISFIKNDSINIIEKDSKKFMGSIHPPIDAK